MIFKKDHSIVLQEDPKFTLRVHVIVIITTIQPRINNFSNILMQEEKPSYG